MAFRLTEAARWDLFRVAMEGLDRFGPLQVDRYEKGLEKTFEFLARTPHAAAERDEFDPPVRVYPFHAHVIIYRIEGDDIVIVGVRHGHEDWQSQSF